MVIIELTYEVSHNFSHLLENLILLYLFFNKKYYIRIFIILDEICTSNILMKFKLLIFLSWLSLDRPTFTLVEVRNVPHYRNNRGIEELIH